MRGRLSMFLLVCWGLLFGAPVWGQMSVPPLQARVTDQVGLLDAPSRQQIEAQLAALEQAKGVQMAVLVVATTQPEGIEQYSMRVAEAWRLGRKGLDDGVLLLVARDDRSMRIEVGYGLEGVIPDAVAKRVIAEVMTPRFRSGDFAGGIDAGVTALARLIAGESLPEPRPGAMNQAVDWLGDALPAVVMFVFVLGGVLRAIFGRLAGAGVAGGLTFIGGWIFFGALVVGIVAGLMVFFFVLVGGHAGGSVGGSVGGLGGRGGGGFTGGGGGFGGGGASGRW